ncbi:hypothetical protein D6779_06270 [Candidatus Parcubacteria bacterium]|nr:MAG: hypothetical protein D6779_06270 [Candidatus Parcubacteria bacterium]
MNVKKNYFDTPVEAQRFAKNLAIFTKTVVNISREGNRFVVFSNSEVRPKINIKEVEKKSFDAGFNSGVQYQKTKYLEERKLHYCSLPDDDLMKIWEIRNTLRLIPEETELIRELIRKGLGYPEKPEVF